MSTMDDREHFGLGHARRVDSLEVIWPDRRYQLLTDLDVDRMVTVRQGDAAPKRGATSTNLHNLHQPFHPMAALQYRHQTGAFADRSEEHTSELQSPMYLV